MHGGWHCEHMEPPHDNAIVGCKRAPVAQAMVRVAAEGANTKLGHRPRCRVTPPRRQSSRRSFALWPCGGREVSSLWCRLSLGNRSATRQLASAPCSSFKRSALQPAVTKKPFLHSRSSRGGHGSTHLPRADCRPARAIALAPRATTGSSRTRRIRVV